MGPVEVFKDAVAVALLAASAAGWGLPAARRLSPGAAPVDRLLAASALGLAFLGVAGFLLGAAGWLRLSAVAVLWAAGWALAWRGRRALAEPEPAFWSGLLAPRAPAWLAGAALAGAFLFAHAPPLMDDSVYIYLAFPQWWAASGAISVFPDNTHSYFPAVVETLYAQLFLVRPAEAAKLLHWAFGAGAGLACARIAWAAGARRLALPAAALVTMPWFASLSGSGKVDLGTLFFALAAVRAWQEWRRTQATGDLAAAGLLAGAVFATKYSGAAVPLGLFLASLPRWRGDGWRQALVFCACAALPALPWLARNWALTGNPVYPVAAFGTEGDAYIYAFYRTQAPATWLAWLGRSWSEIVVGDAIWGVGPFLVAAAPLVLADRAEAPAPLMALGLFIAAVSALAVPGVAAARFIAPGLGVMAAAAGAWLDRRWDAFPPSGRGAVLAGWLAPGVALALALGALRLPLALGLETREHFVRRHWNLPEDYELHRFAASEIPPGSKILFTYLNVAPGFFYPAHRAMGLAAYPPAFYEAPLDEALARLKADGIRWLVTAPGECRFDADGACRLPSFGVRLAWLEEARSRGRLRPLLHGSRSTLYEIV